MKNLNFKMQLFLFCGVFVAMLSSCSDSNLTSQDDPYINTVRSTFDISMNDAENVYLLGDDDFKFPCNASLIEDVQTNIIWSDDCVPSLVLTLCCDCPFKGKEYETGCTTGVNSTFDIRYAPFQAPFQFYTINIPNTSITNGSCFDVMVEITGYDDNPDPSLYLGIGYNGGYNIAYAYSPGCE